MDRGMAARRPSGDYGMPRSYTLVINCPDRPGIVHHVSGLVFEHGGNILESR
jgi:formyltetrahydrofolate deformylase